MHSGHSYLQVSNYMLVRRKILKRFSFSRFWCLSATARFLLGLLMVARVYVSAPFLLFFLCRDMWSRSCNYIIPIGFANLRRANFHASFLILVQTSKCSYLDITYLLIGIKMWLASILIINTLTMLIKSDMPIAVDLH